MKNSGQCRSTGPVIEQPARAHSTHPPVGPFRCARANAYSMPPVEDVNREGKSASRE
jgi:hypothetical protein